MVSAGLGLTSPDLPVVRAEAPAKKGGKLLKKEAVFTKAAPATVLIYIPLSGRAGVGSGVIIESQGPDPDQCPRRRARQRYRPGLFV
jgi:hypothetical protein